MGSTKKRNVQVSPSAGAIQQSGIAVICLLVVVTCFVTFHRQSNAPELNLVPAMGLAKRSPVVQVSDGAAVIKPTASTRGTRINVTTTDMSSVGALTLVLPTTFKDIGRALICIASLRKNMPRNGFVKELLLIVPIGEDIVFQQTLASAEQDGSIPPALSERDDAVTGTRSNSTAATPTSTSHRKPVIRKSLWWRPSSITPPINPTPTSRPWPIRILSEQLALNISALELQAARPNVISYKLQMVLKLWAANWVTTPFYLVLDSDVLMVRSPAFGNDSVGALFPEGVAAGRAVYQPQPRTVHPQWWTDTEATTGIMDNCTVTDEPSVLTSLMNVGKPAKASSWGLGVTPAILSTHIARLTVNHLQQRYPGALPLLRALAWKGGKFRKWTEYVSYSLIACQHGLMDKYHVRRSSLGPKLYDGMWRGSSSAGAVDSSLSTNMQAGWIDRPLFMCANCIFQVLQSNTGLAETRIATELRPALVDNDGLP